MWRMHSGNHGYLGTTVRTLQRTFFSTFDLPLLKKSAMHSHEGNIYALMRMIFNELSGIVPVVMSLLAIMFTVVQVTARLAEYALDKMVQSRSDCVYAVAIKVLRVFVVALLIWWIYFDRLTLPVFHALIDSAAFVFRVVGYVWERSVWRRRRRRDWNHSFPVLTVLYTPYTVVMTRSLCNSSFTKLKPPPLPPLGKKRLWKQFLTHRHVFQSRADGPGTSNWIHCPVNELTVTVPLRVKFMLSRCDIAFVDISKEKYVQRRSHDSIFIINSFFEKPARKLQKKKFCFNGTRERERDLCAGGPHDDPEGAVPACRGVTLRSSAARE